MNDREREAHIKSCGLLMMKAHREGDTAGAREWLRLQTEAINARTPRQIALMEGCYFCETGEEARRFAEMTRIANAGGM
jgi:hypothetical protein